MFALAIIVIAGLNVSWDIGMYHVAVFCLLCGISAWAMRSLLAMIPQSFVPMSDDLLDNMRTLSLVSLIGGLCLTAHTGYGAYYFTTYRVPEEERTETSAMGEALAFLFVGLPLCVGCFLFAISSSRCYSCLKFAEDYKRLMKMTSMGQWSVDVSPQYPVYIEPQFAPAYAAHYVPQPPPYAPQPVQYVVQQPVQYTAPPVQYVEPTMHDKTTTV